MKKIINTLVLALLIGTCLNHLSAQDKKQITKVVVIEKVVDENGKVTEKKVTLEGKEAEEYLAKMDAEEIETIDVKKVDEDNVKIKVKKKEKNVWITEDGEKIDLEEKDAKFISKEKYKIVTIDDDGEEKVIEWDGEGEMPAEMEEVFEENDLDLSDIDNEIDKEKNVIIIKEKDGGEEETIEFDFDGDEIPEEIIEKLREEGLEIEMEEDEDGRIRIEIESDDDDDDFNDDKEENNNKAQLGVMIANVDNGVEVSEIVEDSPAELAGLVKGDVIKMINDDEVDDIESLVGAIGKYDVGDVIIVHFVREGAEMSKEVTLAKRKEMFKHKTWKTVIDEDDDHKVIKKEKKIIIKKKN